MRGDVDGHGALQQGCVEPVISTAAREPCRGRARTPQVRAGMLPRPRHPPAGSGVRGPGYSPDPAGFTDLHSCIGPTSSGELAVSQTRFLTDPGPRTPDPDPPQGAAPGHDRRWRRHGPGGSRRGRRRAGRGCSPGRTARWTCVVRRLTPRMRRCRPAKMAKKNGTTLMRPCRCRVTTSRPGENGSAPGVAR